MFAVLMAVLIVAVAGIGWYVHAVGSARSGTDTPSSASTDSSGEAILLGLAKVAVSEHRLVAPAGHNAYEFYFSVLQLDPANASVHEQLNRLFSRACNDLEQTINARDIEEAQRELALLRDYDSNNYKLALLASKLSAQRMVMVREHEAQAAAIQSQAENRSH